MIGQDLYRETTCAQCKRSYLRAVGFCPHCGHVRSESWSEKLSRWLSAEGTSRREQASSGSIFSVLIGLVLAAVVFFQALRSESLETLIFALVILALAIRAWYSERKPEVTKREDRSVTHEIPSGEGEPKVSLGMSVYHCEGCGADVAEDAIECPKCGMKFG